MRRKKSCTAQEHETDGDNCQISIHIYIYRSKEIENEAMKKVDEEK